MVLHSSVCHKIYCTAEWLHDVFGLGPDVYTEHKIAQRNVWHGLEFSWKL